MKEGIIKIPAAMQIRVDDVGWHIGSDDRLLGQPSRSGLPRNHSVLDYPVLNELGKGLGVHINCSLVLGDWDKENILRGQNYLTWDPENWDRKSKIDMEYAEKAFELLEGSEYIDYVCHGVFHGHYDGGKRVTEKEFYNYIYNEETGKMEFTWHTDEVFRNHMDYFFKLYDMWGFKKPVKAFACGCGSFGHPNDERNEHYCEMMQEYGIRLWENGWQDLNNEEEKGIGVSSGIVCLHSAPFNGGESLAWDAYDVDPEYLKLYYTEDIPFVSPDACIHWTNLIRWNPENNMEFVQKWINHFKKQAEVFGVILSKNSEFAASQAAYTKFAKTKCTEDKYIIDLTDVDKSGVLALKNEFYVSIKNGTVPEKCVGGTIEEYETKKEFKTYKITRDGSNRVEILF